MNMTEKNGQPSMEEILASIRRIIAEEPASAAHGGELRGTPIMLKGDGALDDAGEFDLPAIFRSSPPPASERQTPLLGRLTDAIRSATHSDGRSVANGEDHQHAEAVEVAAADGAFHGLSSLKPVRPEARVTDLGLAGPTRPLAGPSPSHEPQPGPAPAATPMTASGANSEEPKRVMAPFKDTHFLRMAAPVDAAAPSPAPAAPAPVAAPVMPPIEAATQPDFSSIIPAQIDRSMLVTGSPAVPQTPHVAPVSMPPPPLPSAVEHNALVTVPPGGAEETGTIEDTTADLLRPMLRQWLADNMPRMVEKALHIEIAESIKAPKKP
ncbi:DUF2497 domain-containing protein [Hyphomicrobium sp.]|uniref:DUF2497 domain-containing protein n=1 Tax=Hyphomicrobium sp. TaxID=82 RepID=UPI0025C46B8D|nr:DUF2497 domain-containing protein [Hyphomicrobium sp.]MCC7251076.1 DUF2497 domain-containing protein [Hyphomicrobium sp.]